MEPPGGESSAVRRRTGARPGPRHPRVVVGVGESPTSAAALRWASDLCRRRGWLLDVVTAWPDEGEVLVHEVPGHYCDARGRAVSALEGVLARCGLDGGVDRDAAWVRVHVENADTVDALVDHSRGAELLVLGRPASGKTRRAGCPSLSESCQRTATCQVVVVGEDVDEPPGGRHRVASGSA